MRNIFPEGDLLLRDKREVSHLFHIIFSSSALPFKVFSLIHFGYFPK